MEQSRAVGIERIGNVFYRTTDMDAAVRFYTEILGFALKLRDGDRWVAFDVGGGTLALEGVSSPATGNAGATVSLRCSDLQSVVDDLRAKGARVTDVEAGPHEMKSTLRDPDGNQLVLYESRRPT